MKDILINGRYRVDQKIGEGGFGLVYAGTDVVTEKGIAIKLIDKSNGRGSLDDEAEPYKLLRGGIGVPQVLWVGEEEEHGVLIQELLGPSIGDLFTYCGEELSLKTTLLLADQAISRLQLIHDRGLIHRDVKPENFLMGLGNEGNRLYIIDFGAAKELAEAEEDQGRDLNRKLIGTCLFASINNHCGREQSRADDLEALGYMLLYLCNGPLPWEELIDDASGDFERWNEVVKKSKLEITVEELCEGAPKEFETYLNYTRSLGFAGGRPDYAYLRSLFRRAFNARRFKHDHVFDWTEKLFKEMQDQSEMGSEA